MACIDVRGMAAAVLLVVGVGTMVSAQPSRFAQTFSRSQYVHWIELYDADEHKIDPADPSALPYSPTTTCGKCHDYQTIAHGYHFNAMDQAAGAGRKGEPWIWTDRRTGTQIPLSYRGWPGTYDPRALGITTRQFLLKFGRQLPGGGLGQAAAVAAGEPSSGGAPTGDGTNDPPASPSEADALRWKQSGALAIDCMFCHSGGRSYNAEVWSEQIANENFAWAATAASGLAKIDGNVKSLPEDYDPSNAAADEKTPSRLPRTTYDLTRFNTDKQTFFDIVRKPLNNACYYCHTVHPVGEGTLPSWDHDEDVHVKAGLACADCHRNGIGHHTVRGFPGEEHPTGVPVSTLSCRGCHLGESSSDDPADGGRMGAPRPLHRGLPPLHFEKMSCTACHSGPRPTERVGQVQTAMAHGLGLPSHQYKPDDPPGIVQPVLLRDHETLYPYRLVWPAFWGTIKDGNVTPLSPDDTYRQLRRVLRVRRDFRQELVKVRLKTADKIEALGPDRAKTPEAELTEDEKQKLADLQQAKGIEAFQEKLVKALTTLAKTAGVDGAEPIYVTGGRAYRLAGDGKIESFTPDAAKPYAWKLGHDVRPARWSTGASGCFECHRDGAPLFESRVTAVGQAPDAEPWVKPLYQMQGYDKTKLDVWNESFRGRSTLKWFGLVAMGVVALILLLYLLLGINGLLGFFFRRKGGA